MEKIFLTAEQARKQTQPRDIDEEIKNKIAKLFQKQIETAIKQGYYKTYISINKVKAITTNKVYFVNNVVHQLIECGYHVTPYYDYLEKGLSGYDVSWKE